MSIHQAGDLQLAGNSIGNNVESVPVTITNPAGLGALSDVPAGTANGAALGAMPAGAIGVRIYLGPADAVTFTVATVAPTVAPTTTIQISGVAGAPCTAWDEALGLGAMIYVTAKAGTPKFRWY
jgi:hypothetical protein